MISILPLDKLSDEIVVALEERGISKDDVKLALFLDLSFDGRYGESWLIVDQKAEKLYCVSAPHSVSVFKNDSLDPHTHHNSHKHNHKLSSEKESENVGFDHFEEYDLSCVKNWHVDSFISSNRILARDFSISSDSEGNELEFATIVLSYCTNTRKNRLFAFLDILERLQKGEDVKDDDEIFNQFNLKCPKCGETYPDQERKICENCKKSKAILKRLLKYFLEFKPQLAMVIFGMLSSTAFQIISPLISGKLLFDQVISEPNPELGLGKLHSESWVIIVVGITVLMSLISVIIGIFQGRANAYMSTKVTLNMKLDIFDAMQRLSLSFFNNNQTGGLVTRVNYDAQHIRSFFVDGVPPFLIMAINFIGVSILLFFMNWKLTLIVFLPIPFVVLIFKKMTPKIWRMDSKMWRRSSSLSAVLHDSLNGIRVVKAFAKETDESHRFREAATNYFDAALQANKISLIVFPLAGLLTGLAVKAIWGFGGIQVMNQAMTYGEFTAYLSYLGLIFGPISFFTSFTSTVTQTINSAQRMFEILDAVPEIMDAEDAVEIYPIKGQIEFKKVCFHYAPNRPILNNVSFKIHPGDHVGLVGHTGAGKSTIANLMNRLYDVVSGSIEIDGVNVKKIKGSSLHRGIAIVSQEIFMFRGSIADNIRYARPDAPMEEIIKVAKAANAHEFIMNLPDGYETVIGTGSRSLSGGERQRVSIARALLLNPSILILDEATAAMDTETERLIQEALESLSEGRTTVSIAHRLSTLRDCNYLMALENGEIVEMGSHAELIAKKGVYYKLYKLQADAMKKVLTGT